ncbi:hypothetical protein BTJ40_09335 [Microbulbifer sp. A4B17]|uniref:transporter substrate-binding domain-containing protein n=1 Tax=Microbulbifer sp. A4B17 TaxID=359370 RepID=UPI000D52AFE4|nr:transporter substrate-binding domain-containing protein [Microbulbifer sp. A4B17]AWF80998.1 hypothetical protein BTJ40_09335 [Microbulbifer sp. A4B17]
MYLVPRLIGFMVVFSLIYAGYAWADLEDRELIAGVTYDIPGLAYRDPSSGAIEGFEPDLVRAIGERLFGGPGYIKLIRVLDEDRVQALQDGRVDMVVSQFTITPEREEEVDFTIPYYVTGEGLLVHEDSDIESFSDLEGKRIAVTKGSLSLKRMRAVLPSLKGAKLIVAPTSSATLEAVQSGNADAASNDIINLILLRKASAYPTLYRLVNISGDFPPKPFGIGVKKGNKELLERLNTVLESLKASGEISRILDKAVSSVGPTRDPSDNLSESP